MNERYLLIKSYDWLNYHERLWQTRISHSIGLPCCFHYEWCQTDHPLVPFQHSCCRFQGTELLLDLAESAYSTPGAVPSAVDKRYSSPIHLHLTPASILIFHTLLASLRYCADGAANRLYDAFSDDEQKRELFVTPADWYLSCFLC